MVLIPNMQLPNSCSQCPILQVDNETDYFCPLIINYLRKEDVEKCRDPYCPMESHEWNELDNKCKSGEVKIYPDGENELDPCEYVLVDRRENCIVEVLQCQKCGHTEVIWTDKDAHPDMIDDVLDS